jgi:hypothetical protein
VLGVQFPRFLIARLDKLEDYALGAWYAHLLALPSASAGNPVKPLLDEATTLRAALLDDAEALARRGPLDADAVAGTSYDATCRRRTRSPAGVAHLAQVLAEAHPSGRPPVARGS